MNVMSKLKFSFIFHFFITSPFSGVGFAYYVGSNLPERVLTWAIKII